MTTITSSADLLVTCGEEVHEFYAFNAPSTGAWSPFTWSPSFNRALGPDVGVFVKRVGEILVFEVEVSQASIVVGQPARPTVEAQVEVTPGRGWTLVQDCARAWPHSWMPQRAACRRYALYPAGKPALQAQAIDLAQMYGFAPSWARARLNYGPCNMKMPALTVPQMENWKVQFTGWLAGIQAALQSGTAFHAEDYEDGPVTAGYAGWRPHGPVDRGAPAGSGVYFDSGHQGDPLMVPFFWLQACCAYERAWHAFDRATGRPITADDYPDGALKYSAGTGDPNNGWLPEFTGVAPWPDPLPVPYDAAHSTRGFRHAVALSEMTDSPMVKRMIASEAAQLRLQFGERGAPAAYGYTPPNLRNWIAQAKLAPNTGGGMQAGRIAGWPAYICAHDVKINGKTGSEKFCAAHLDWWILLTPQHGIGQRVHQDSGVWFDPNFDTAHSFEAPIAYYGVAGCAKQLGVMVPRSLSRAAISLLETIRKAPYYGEVGPMYYPYVAVRGGAPVNPLVDGKGADATTLGDADHQLSFAALAYTVTKDDRFLQDGLGVGLPATTIAEKRANLESRTKLYGSAFLLALYQAIP